MSFLLRRLALQAQHRIAPFVQHRIAPFVHSARASLVRLPFRPPARYFSTPEPERDNTSQKEQQSKDGKKAGDQKPGGGSGFPQLSGLQLALLLSGVGTLLFAAMPREILHEITWQQFYTDHLSKGEVSKLVVVNNSYVKVYLKSGGSQLHDDEHFEGHEALPTVADRANSKFSIGSVDHFEEQLDQAQRQLGVAPERFVPLIYRREMHWMAEAARLLPTVLLFGVWWFLLTRQGAGGGAASGGRNIFQIGKASPVIVTKASEVSTTFGDVAGLQEAKAEVMEFVNFLNNPTLYTQLGARIPKGALLLGPPGCGKTLLARAVAGEAKVPFLSVSGSDFVEMFVGVGPSRVRDLFAQARTHAPCILFIDEIDAVGRARGQSGFAGGGNDERENTLNQLLVEMDGFSTQSGVIVLAGTNRADVLDKALLRPGRFDRQIVVDKPDVKGREQIFAVHLRPLKLAKPIDDFVARLAALTPGFSGADIASCCNEAALIAARRGAESIDNRDFDQAIDRVVAGLEKKSAVLPPEEKRVVAHHEAGHATVSWFLEHAAPLLKVSIIPRAKALGYAQYLPKEDYLTTKEQLEDMMCVALGGRVAEELIFDRITSGAQDDLDKVTKIALSAITVYGMNERLGPLAFPPRDEHRTVRPYSDATARLIDDELRRMITHAHTRTTQLLRTNIDGLRRLAALLMEREAIDAKDVVAALGPRPFPLDPRVVRLMEHSQTV